MFKNNSYAVRLTDISKNYVIYTEPKYWFFDFMGLHKLLEEGKHYRSFWALRDIKLEIPMGGRVALIGRNGAGKSTLLRIISGNIAPTTGSVILNGHCEALLELGTGFNPQFTGRENIFTALAYKGLTGREAENKLWDIVDFSELDEFINQPINTYSSGMYLRLAFAVATVVIPEILIIDEILAAGDMYFQSKCMARMTELTANRGTTVIFVSHDMDAAQRLCDTFVWIDRGKIVAAGPSADVRVMYEESVRKQQNIRMRARNLRLSRKTLTNLQSSEEDGIHLLGRFMLDTDDHSIEGPCIKAIRLYVRNELQEEILVGDAMDDNADHYSSFIISDRNESTWCPPSRIDDGMSRTMLAGKADTDGAKFALFLAYDDFTAEHYRLELEISYKDSSQVPCSVEINTGLAGLKKVLSLEHSGDGICKTARAVIPQWIYASLEGEDKQVQPQAIPDTGNSGEEQESEHPVVENIEESKDAGSAKEETTEKEQETVTEDIYPEKEDAASVIHQYKPGNVPLDLFTEGTEKATVEYRDNQLHVTSVPRRWHYAAIAPLPEFPDIKGAAVIMVRAKVIDGEMAFGVFKDQTVVVVEKSFPAADMWMDVRLDIPVFEDVDSIVLRSSAIDGIKSEALIDSITVAKAEFFNARPARQENEIQDNHELAVEETGRSPDYTVSTKKKVSLENKKGRFGTGQVLMDKIQFFDENGNESYVFRHGKQMSIVITYRTIDMSLLGTSMLVAGTFQRIDGVNATTMISTMQNRFFTIEKSGKIAMKFDHFMLTKGTYWLYICLLKELDLHGFNAYFTENPKMYDMLRKTNEFVVEGSYKMESGIYRQPVQWEVIH